MRAIGSDLHMDYTAVGQTTHLAARMEQLAEPGHRRSSPPTPCRLAEGYVEVEPLGPVPVKGLADPVEVYELTGAGPRRSRLSGRRPRAGSPASSGGTRSWSSSARRSDAPRRGHGQVVAIVGEPGVGKSRLVWEFTHSHRTHGWLVLQAGSVSYGKATPYLPVIDLLKGYFADRGPRRARARSARRSPGKLLTLDRALEPALPALLALLDVPVDDRQWAALDPPAAPPADPRRR